MEPRAIKDESKKELPKGGSFFQRLVEFAFYGVCVHYLIVLVGTIFNFITSLNWFIIPVVSVIAGAYCFRKFLIFLILRKKS